MQSKIPTTIRQKRFVPFFSSCAYCGTEHSADREDPIPRGLYPKTIRGGVNLLKIPACKSCNHTKSQVDGALRDYLVLNVRTSEHPLTQELLRDTFHRAVSENHVRLLDGFFDGRDVQLITPNGIWAGTGYEIPADHEPVQLALKWMIRGLHWAAFEQVIPEGNAKVRFLTDDDIERSGQVFKMDSFHGKYEQGEVFTCGWSASPDGDVFWVLVFFGRDMFFGRTVPTGDVVDRDD